MLYYCEQYHRFLQLQKMTTKVSSLFTNYEFSKGETDIIDQKMGSPAVHQNQSAGL